MSIWAGVDPKFDRVYLNTGCELFDMKFVQESMGDRSKYDTHDSDEYQATEECVSGGE